MATISEILRDLAAQLKPSAVCSVCGHALRDHTHTRAITGHVPEHCRHCRCTQFRMFIQLPDRLIPWLPRRVEDFTEELTPVERPLTMERLATAETIDEEQGTTHTTHPLCVCGHSYENHLVRGARGACQWKQRRGDAVCDCTEYRPNLRSMP